MSICISIHLRKEFHDSYQPCCDWKASTSHQLNRWKLADLGFAAGAFSFDHFDFCRNDWGPHSGRFYPPTCPKKSCQQQPLLGCCTRVRLRRSSIDEGLWGIGCWSALNMAPLQDEIPLKHHFQVPYQLLYTLGGHVLDLNWLLDLFYSTGGMVWYFGMLYWLLYYAFTSYSMHLTIVAPLKFKKCFFAVLPLSPLRQEAVTTSFFTFHTLNTLGGINPSLAMMVLVSRCFFQTFFISSLPGKRIHFDYLIFFNWVETTN